MRRSCLLLAASLLVTNCRPQTRLPTIAVADLCRFDSGQRDLQFNIQPEDVSPHPVLQQLRIYRLPAMSRDGRQLAWAEQAGRSPLNVVFYDLVEGRLVETVQITTSGEMRILTRTWLPEPESQTAHQAPAEQTKAEFDRQRKQLAARIQQVVTDRFFSVPFDAAYGPLAAQGYYYTLGDMAACWEAEVAKDISLGRHRPLRIMPGWEHCHRPVDCDPNDHTVAKRDCKGRKHSEDCELEHLDIVIYRPPTDCSLRVFKTRTGLYVLPHPPGSSCD